MSASENQIVVYQPNDMVRLDVRLENETVWLTQAQLCALFQRDVSVISRHIKNIFTEGELDKESNLHFLQIASADRPVAFYSLDVIISVGYRVKSVVGTRFRQWANKILKEYLLRGYSVNSRLNQLEDKVDRRMAKVESDISDLKDKVDFFVQTKEPPIQGVFYDGRLWDARALVLKLIGSAKRSLILIDNWATPEVLDLFSKKRAGVKVTIFTSEHYDKNHVPRHKISDADVKTFNGQYPSLAVHYNETFHDRFLIIDDRELYLIGASLKDLGKKCFAFTKLDAGEIRRIKKEAFSCMATPQKSKPDLRNQAKINGSEEDADRCVKEIGQTDRESAIEIMGGNGRLKALSLFANVGIAETYLKEVGVDVVVANELLPERARFYQHLYPECNMICGDIQDAKVFKSIQAAAKKSQVNFIIATPPCQGMSPAGKKDSFDPRNQLITYAVDMIEILQPKFVLLENVMQQLKTMVRHKGELVLIPDYLKARLEAHYRFNENPVIDMKFYGVPQQRKRAIYLLARKDTNIDWQFPPKEEKIVTLRDAIGQLPSLDPLIVEPEYRYKLPDYEKKRDAGLKVSKWHYAKAHLWRHVEILQHTPEGQSARQNKVFFPKKDDNTPIKGAPRTYMRMSWDRPAPTITIQNASVTSFQTIHPGRLTTKKGIYSDPRVLSIFELMRVSTLPDDWSIPEWASESLIRRVIGEGIPPLLVKKIVAKLRLGGEQ